MTGTTARSLTAAAILATLTTLVTPAMGTEKVPRGDASGTPVIEPGSGPAYSLWQDESGWHLRWTGKALAAPTDKKPVFTGLVTVPSGKISIIKPAGMTGGDDSLNRLDGHRAMFKSEATTSVEGIDFKTSDGAGSIHLELFVDYDVIGPKMVFLGKGRTHPADMSPLLHIDLQSPAAATP